MSVCARCSVDTGPRPGRRATYCRACSRHIDHVIARWVDGDRDLTNAEFGAELGVTEDFVAQRVSRLKRSAHEVHRSQL